MSANEPVIPISTEEPIDYARLFRDYQLDGAFDEMRTSDGAIRPEYQALWSNF